VYIFQCSVLSVLICVFIIEIFDANKFERQIKAITNNEKCQAEAEAEEEEEEEEQEKKTITNETKRISNNLL
jgi:hypothetical protein